MSSSVSERVAAVLGVAPPAGTQVTSVEAMAALPVGTHVDLRYGDRTEKWLREDTGWVCVHRGDRGVPVGGRFPVGERFFIGVLTNNMVTVSTPPLPEFVVGQVLAVGDYTYIVHEVLDDGRARLGAFRDRGWVGWDEANPQFLTRHDLRATPMDQVPAQWMLTLLVAASRERTALTEARDERDRSLRQAVNDRDQAMQERNEARTELRDVRARQSIPQGLVDALKAYASDADDDDLDRILNDYGIGRQTDVEVTAVITGYNYVQHSETEAARELGITTRQITGIEDGSVVRWRKEVTVTRTVEAGSCACDDVSDEDSDVENEVPAGAESWEIDSTSCGND